jgi:hypothetical protein
VTSDRADSLVELYEATDSGRQEVGRLIVSSGRSQRTIESEWHGENRLMIPLEFHAPRLHPSSCSPVPKEVYMKIHRLVVAVTLALYSLSVGFAEEPSGPPQPTAEHKDLAMWLGSWTGNGEMKPGPFGPGGPMQWTEECSWFAGARFHVMCKSKGNGPTGPMVGLGIIGYDAGKKVYTHYGVDNNGWSGFAVGNRSGDNWTFRSTETVEGKTYQSRFTMGMEAPRKMTFTWEVSEDGKKWTVLMDGTSTKE